MWLEPGPRRTRYAAVVPVWRVLAPLPADSLLQVQFIRGRLASTMPMLFKPVKPDLKVGEPNVPMSPLEAIFVISVLIDQKIQNGEFQLSPAEWDRDVYTR